MSSARANARPQLLDPLEVKGALIALFRSPDYKPPVLPAVATELLTLSRRPDVSIDALSELMGRDPMLAGHVLRIAQSAGRSARTPPVSLKDATLRLGVRRVADLFVQACAETEVFRCQRYSVQMETLRRHSVFTAELSRLVSRRLGASEEYAYLCGLLHDVGIAGILQALERLAVELPFETIWPYALEIHESCSEYLAKVWALPDDVTRVLGLHHSLVLDGNDPPGAAIVAVADGLAHEVGYGSYSQVDTRETDAAAHCAGLDKEAVAKLRDEASALASAFAA